MNKAKIIWVFTQNEGECFDDEETYCGQNTKSTLQEDIVDWDEVGEKLESILEIPADYGDGVTNSRILAVVDAKTNEILPKESECWSRGGDEE